MAEVDQQPVRIAEALEGFLAEQRARLSERIYRRYEQVIELLCSSLDSYACSSLVGEEQQRWQHACDAGDEQAYCHVFGPEKIAEHLGSFWTGSWSER
jgi:hypothetical protein